MAACASCGTDVPETGKFCPGCGSPAPVAEAPAEPTACANCGQGLKSGARFCAACGTPVSVAAPAAPPACTGCGQELVEGRAFCGNCGTPAGGASAQQPAAQAPAATQTQTRGFPTPGGPPPSPPTRLQAGNVPNPAQPPVAPQARPQGGGFPNPGQPPPAPPPAQPRPGSFPAPGQPLAAQAGAAAPGVTPRPRPQTSGKLDILQIGTLVAFAVAAVSTALPWISTSGFDFNTWDAGARFRFGDWFELDKGDGYVIVVVALVGIASALGPIVSPSIPKYQYVPGAIGALIVIIAGLEWQFINDQGGGLDPAYGVYVLGAAGIAAAVLGFMADRPAVGRR